MDEHVHHDACVSVSLSDSSSFKRFQRPEAQESKMAGISRDIKSRVSCYTCEHSPEYLTEFAATN